MAPYDASSTAQSSRSSSIQSERHYVGRVSSQDYSRLHPEAALAPSDFSRADDQPKKAQRQRSLLGRSDTVTTATHASGTQRARKERRRGRSGGRRRNGTWKKLLWVKQSFPDNYTDEETFLDHLQRNPRLRPYEFWPLVADSTIIVQHICSVVIFVCCFTAIFQERVGPQTVVTWATVGTVAGWVLRDWWQGWEEAEEAAAVKTVKYDGPDGEREELDFTLAASASEPISSNVNSSMLSKDSFAPLSGNSATTAMMHVRDVSSTSAGGKEPSPISDPFDTPPDPSLASPRTFPPYRKPSAFSPRNQARLTTAKSAILIYCSLLGLSPILKSLTKSTSSDSIWALSTWLMLLNLFTFDYGAGPESKFPASLSTNAALMASTVLASRLPSTTHVFSLTLFSIEVFGLFPVFRRHLRHHSWTGHAWLTAFLVAMAGGCLSMTISGGGWGMGIVGVVLGGIVTGLSMGMTSWWLIGLQRYKNEIHGPWDPARPVIRRGWD